MTTSVRRMAFWLRALLALAVGAVFLTRGQGLQDQRMLDIAAVCAGVAGTLLGFLITAVALLTAVMDRTLVANMIKTGHYQRLVDDTFLTCGLLLGVLLASILSLFLEGTPLRAVFALMLVLFSLSGLYVIEAGRRFSVVMRTLR